MSLLRKRPLYDRFQTVETKPLKFSVVTLLRGDRDPSGQQFLERPEMIGQPQSHRRRPLLIAMHAIVSR